MRRSGYFEPRVSPGPSNDAEVSFNEYFVPYVESNVEQICAMIREHVKTKLSHYFGMQNPGQVQTEILKDILAVVEQHMLSVTGVQRGAGIGSFFASLVRWLLPKARTLVSLIPSQIKTAAATAATDLAVQGINRVQQTISQKISGARSPGSSTDRGGAIIQACANSALRCLCEEAVEHQERGGFAPLLLSLLGGVIPSVISALIPSRGGGLGPYWDKLYPVPDNRGSGHANRKRRAPVSRNCTSKRVKCEPSTSRTRGGAHAVPTHTVIMSEPSSTHSVFCTVKVEAGRKGGRPVTRHGYCNRNELDNLH
ncbi:LO6 [Symphysodon discus adomavirus 1]|uniref:LO6 n=1 Tax=Symphysodon discus adomavirus 1 TaxID=2175118 RepID=A0A2S1MK37_9VIRU|nr:LO6 [Symphysodon discus adomavirus 1]AWG87406.1 LO6 [Symphysodon discus adomavirus 1]